MVLPNRAALGAAHHNEAVQRDTVDIPEMEKSGTAAMDKAPPDGMEPGKARAMWVVPGRAATDKVWLVVAASDKA